MNDALRGRLRRWAPGVLALVGATTLVAVTPALLRRVDLFRVDRVEVVGTRYLAAHEALQRSGITRESSVFDDPAPWLAALREHPLVVDARAERDLPGTIVLTITEIEPIALARTPELMPVADDGRVLPINPALTDLDLPVIIAGTEVADGRLADAGALALVDELVTLRRQAPAFLARVSAVEAMEGGAVRYVLRDPARAETLMPRDAGAVRLEQLRRTIADLTSRRELDRVRRIDLRFRDQVVVSLNLSAES